MPSTNNKGVIPEKWLNSPNKQYLSRFVVVDNDNDNRFSLDRMASNYNNTLNERGQEEEYHHHHDNNRKRRAQRDPAEKTSKFGLDH